jgi:hypothetical protein
VLIGHQWYSVLSFECCNVIAHLSRACPLPNGNMMNEYVPMGVALYKRAVGAGDDLTDPTNLVLPSWAWVVFLLDAAVFLPVILFVSRLNINPGPSETRLPRGLPSRHLQWANTPHHRPNTRSATSTPP